MDARRIALSILNRLDRKQGTLDYLLDGVPGKYPKFSAKDQALLRAILFGVLRRKNRLDWIITHFSKTPFQKIDPKVKNVLRIGLFQIIYLDRIPVSAAVNTSVEMVKPFGGKWLSGFVNAVLRNCARHHREVNLPEKSTSPAEALCINHSIPLWILKRWHSRMEAEELEQLCTAVNTDPVLTVRTNTMKIARKDLLSRFEKLADEIRPTPCAPDGISFIRPGKAVSEWVGFQKGWFQVQDEAAQLVVLLLEPKPGETVLDACCGFGGKTGYIGRLMNNSGKILAVDRNLAKLNALKNEMNRLGLSIVQPFCSNLLNLQSTLSENCFNRVFLDAPCSGMGVLNRNPDIRWNLSQNDIQTLSNQQKQLLNSIATMVIPGGVIVYCVCSIEPEENEQVIHAFLESHKNFIVDTQLKLPAGCEMFDIVSKGFFKSFPHRHYMDGFFAARLKRLVR
jgi:16S rRNA (cytosine967-C5)-methyltransferase